ncbi:MAG: beta-lactamase family protein [Acidobacteria bacterium]|nr:beta-lactamase family protein [Acidobacteriota bacterium]
MKMFGLRFGVFTLCLLSIISNARPVAAFFPAAKNNSVQSTKVDEFVTNEMKTSRIPGASLAVIKSGRIIFLKGYGSANLELDVKAVPQTNYLIASVTKSFTAIALMSLWEEGKFDLDDAIGKYLDDLPEHWKPLTIRQLLSHTSGIPTNLDPESGCKFDFDPDKYTRKNFLQEVECLPLDFEPGTKWKYSSSTGYTLLGSLIEKLSGKTYEVYLIERIFDPLKMHETRMLDHDRLKRNRADGYNFEDGEFSNSERLDPVGEFASGGLVSTVLDLAKFDAALYSARILKRTTLEKMWTNARLNDGTVIESYGLGFGLTPFKGQKRVGHTGGTPGYSSCYTRFTEKKISVILLTNTNHKDFNVGEMCNEIAAFYF